MSDVYLHEFLQRYLIFIKTIETISGLILTWKNNKTQFNIYETDFSGSSNNWR